MEVTRTKFRNYFLRECVFIIFVLYFDISLHFPKRIDVSGWDSIFFKMMIELICDVGVCTQVIRMQFPLSTYS